MRIEKAAPVGEEGRHQHHALHAVDQRGRGKQRDQRTGRMGEDVVGAAAVRQTISSKNWSRSRIVAETMDMAALAVAEQPVGTTLAAPVHDGAAEAAFRQVRGGLEILLDAFVAAGQQDHRALQRAAGGREQAVAQLDAVARGEKPAAGIFRSRIAGDSWKRSVMALLTWFARPAERLTGDRKPAPKAKKFPVEPAPKRGRPEAALGGLPASVDPGGRDVTPGSASSRCLSSTRLVRDASRTLARPR